MIVISRSQLEYIAPSSEAVISGVKHISSYNWIDAPTPTIVVPGAPARWNPPKGPQDLAADSGDIYEAQYAARKLDCPLEPLFRSVHAEHDAFDLNAVDVVTDRGNIRKLLSFITLEPKKKKYFEGFTIYVEVVQNTALFCRDEAVTAESGRDYGFWGHGCEFEKAYTVPRVAGSTAHHRVISYQFGGLHFLVRHETDGYVEDTGDSCGSVARAMQGLVLAPTTAPTRMAGSTLSVARGGEVVPLCATLEIKTHTIRYMLTFSKLAARQLWISQTPKLVRACHDRGWFEEPQVEDVTAQIQQWEADNQPILKKLAWLMQRIVVLTKASPGGRVRIKCHVPGDKLVISPYDGPKLLPADLYAKWTAKAPSSRPTSPAAAKETAENAQQNTKRVNGTGIGQSTAVTSMDPTAAHFHFGLPTPDAAKGGQDKTPN
ncbi:geranylgeranyl pyrophosphate synthetase [Cordyceps militaris CM01]|uniref:Geranylgeranyl pyrophosphate synthetase n=2 Tax=Cordyceps militaris TaxID=73501 RepID=G3JK64_CORMM|nr:geranylgeranyl pyrophosphate synthetase [Cordyceps militaris CM01]AGM34467.1 geranylgeranyl diphosphate synthase 3 [Cordyceps militaris]EGX92194.1 geranylgeranyl pyrophosphate synthetase [Cordyceps militaris CM01]